MKKCYLDANFLIHARNKDAPEHAAASAKLEMLAKDKYELYISPLIIDEFIHTLLSIKRLNKNNSRIIDLRKDLQQLLDLPKIVIINPPIDKKSQFLILEFMQKYNLKPRDSYHLLTMLSNSIDTFATFDSDFKKVFSSKLLLPD